MDNFIQNWNKTELSNIHIKNKHYVFCHNDRYYIVFIESHSYVDDIEINYISDFWFNIIRIVIPILSYGLGMTHQTESDFDYHIIQQQDQLHILITNDDDHPIRTLLGVNLETKQITYRHDQQDQTLIQDLNMYVHDQAVHVFGHNQNEFRHLKINITDGHSTVIDENAPWMNENMKIWSRDNVVYVINFQQNILKKYICDDRINVCETTELSKDISHLSECGWTITPQAMYYCDDNKIYTIYYNGDVCIESERCIKSHWYVYHYYNDDRVAIMCGSKNVEFKLVHDVRRYDRQQKCELDVEVITSDGSIYLETSTISNIDYFKVMMEHKFGDNQVKINYPTKIVACWYRLFYSSHPFTDMTMSELVNVYELSDYLNTKPQQAKLLDIIYKSYELEHIISNEKLMSLDSFIDLITDKMAVLVSRKYSDMRPYISSLSNDVKAMILDKMVKM